MLRIDKVRYRHSRLNAMLPIFPQSSVIVRLDRHCESHMILNTDTKVNYICTCSHEQLYDGLVP